MPLLICSKNLISYLNGVSKMIGFYWMGRFISLYGVMIAVGVLIAGFIGFRLTIRHGLSENWFFLFLAYALGGGLLGSKLLFLLINSGEIQWSRILEPDYLVQVMEGGFVFYGGVIGGVLMLLLGNVIHRQPVLKYVEAVIPCLPIAHAFGRIGCHFASCCYGIPYEGPFHIVYHAPAFAPVEIPLFPVQLLEAALNLILAACLLLYVLRKGCTVNSIAIYGISYGILRFFLEYLRYDAEERGGFLIFSTSQWISIFIVLTVLIVRPFVAGWEKKAAAETSP